jgi:branched-chain amino acid transport system substrate-binding protein
MKKITTTIMAASLAAGVGAAASAQTQGVTDTEIVVGSVNDLSGPFAAVGVPATAGANLYFDAINEAGGVNGRKIRFVVEDHSYQIPKAMQGFNKLLNKDKAFAMLLSLGTPMNMAGFKLLDPKGIPNIGPLSAAQTMLQDPIGNKFTGFSSYWDQVQAGVTYLAGEFGGKEICSMYIPSGFGVEIGDSTKDVAKSLGLTFAGETTHKPDELDFVGSLSKLKSAGCDVITLGLTVKQGITAVGTAKKLGWTDVKFLNTSAGFLGLVAAIPGGVTEGLYAASGWVDLGSRATEEAPAKFIAAYKAKYDKPASGFAMLGYSAAETFVRALEAAGPDLTQESFIAAMESLDYFDALTDSQITYGPGDHRGADDIVISVVKDGAWSVVSRQ